MVEAIMNLLLLLFAAVLTAAWIKALCESGGRCHFEDCEGCVYEGNCPEERSK